MAQPEFRSDSILEKNEYRSYPWRTHRGGKFAESGSQTISKAEVWLFQSTQGKISEVKNYHENAKEPRLNSKKGLTGQAKTRKKIK